MTSLEAHIAACAFCSDLEEDWSGLTADAVADAQQAHFVEWEAEQARQAADLAQRSWEGD